VINRAAKLLDDRLLPRKLVENAVISRGGDPPYPPAARPMAKIAIVSGARKIFRGTGARRHWRSVNWSVIAGKEPVAASAVCGTGSGRISLILSLICCVTSAAGAAASSTR